MNPRSSLSELKDGHGVDLITGEAYVVVAHASADFLVEAGGERLSSQSGEFNVRTSARETCVTCLAGSLERQRDGERHLLRAGDQLVTLPDGETRLERVDPARASGWRRGLLIFRDTPRSAGLEDINPYRDGQHPQIGMESFGENVFH